MRKFGEISWEVREDNTGYLKSPYSSQGGDSFEFFLNYCKTKIPSENLYQSYQLFFRQKNQLYKDVKDSVHILAQQPFLAAFLVWIKEIAIDPPTRLAAKTLLENGFIGITDKEGHVWTIANAKLFDHRNVIEAIRCHHEWAFLLKESFVKTYMDFMHWLYEATFGYIEYLRDPDAERVQGRSLAYLNFINFLSKLKDEDQLFAKLLYFGGSRTLDEILTLEIENIDFNKQLINFGLNPITYPLHVFADIKNLIGNRKKGKLFIGRRGTGTALNPATIFRNFKEGAIEVGLGKNFTPKVLTTNIN